jgi:hypothetical protein
MVDENFIQEAYNIDANNSMGNFEMANKDPIITRETQSPGVSIAKEKISTNKKMTKPKIKKAQVTKSQKQVKKTNTKKQKHLVKDSFNKAFQKSENAIKQASIFASSMKKKINLPNKKGEVKKSKKNKAKLNNIITIMAVIAIIAISLLILNMDKLFANNITPVAIVNGEIMTTQDIELTLNTIPAQYKSLMTDEIVLNQTIINFLLMQESRKKGLEANNDQAEEKINEAITLSQLSKSEFKDYLKEQNMTYEGMIEFYRVHLSIEKFLLDHVYNDIIISENDIIEFYNQNKDLLGNATLEEVGPEIRIHLIQQKESVIFTAYVSELMLNADIQIIGEKSVSSSTSSFSSKEVEKYSACAVENGLSKGSIIFVYSDSCPHCTRMKPIIKDLEETYEFYWASASDSSSKAILRDCFSDVLAGGVPQFICSKNGKSLVGEKPKAVLEDFTIACNS